MKKFENYVSNLRVLERADKESLERELQRHYGDGLGICTEGSGNLDEGEV